MGMVLRFPVERARSAPGEIFAEEPARILILPTVRIERGEDDAELVSPEIDTRSDEPGSAGSRRRRRTPRN
jgi:hypothetical protein